MFLRHEIIEIFIICAILLTGCSQSDSEQIRIDAPKEPSADSLANIGTSNTNAPLQPDTFPTAISNLRLTYPEEAKKAGVEGTVVLRVLIDETGKVKETEIIQGLGYGLDEASIKAVQQVTWKPARKNDQPLEAWIAYPVRWKLK